MGAEGKKVMDVHGPGPSTPYVGGKEEPKKRVPLAEQFKQHLEATRAKTIKEFDEACAQLYAHEYGTQNYREIKAQLQKCVQLAKKLAPASKQQEIDQLATTMLETAKKGRQGYKQLSRAMKVQPGEGPGMETITYESDKADKGAKKAALSMKEFLEEIALLQKHALSPHPTKEAKVSPRTAITQKVQIVLQLIEKRLEHIESTPIFRKQGISKKEVIEYIKNKEYLQKLEDNPPVSENVQELALAELIEKLHEREDKFLAKFEKVKKKEKKSLELLFNELHDLSNLYDAIKKAGKEYDLPKLQELIKMAVADGVVRMYFSIAFNQLLNSDTE